MNFNACDKCSDICQSMATVLHTFFAPLVKMMASNICCSRETSECRYPTRPFASLSRKQMRLRVQTVANIIQERRYRLNAWRNVWRRKVNVLQLWIAPYAFDGISHFVISETRNFINSWPESPYVIARYSALLVYKMIFIWNNRISIIMNVTQCEI